MSPVFRSLADLTDLGSRFSNDVTTCDELREPAYMVATVTGEEEQVAALEAAQHLRHPRSGYRYRNIQE
jgi:hypothetical protein